MLTKEEILRIKQCPISDYLRFTRIFDALRDVGRLRIFRLLMQYQDLCVTDIAHVLGVSLPAASQQLKALELADIAKKERRGQMICYQIKKDDPVVRSIIKIFS